MNLRVASEKILNVCLSVSMFTVIFIAPIKFGIPWLESNNVFFPESVLEAYFSSWPIEIFFIMVSVVVAVYFLKMAFSDEIVIKRSSVDVLMLVLCGVLLASSIFSINKNASVVFVSQFFSYVFLYWIVLSSRNKINIVLFALLSGAAVVALYGVYQKYFGFEQLTDLVKVFDADNPYFDRIYGKLKSGRVFSTFVYPNSLAGYLLTLMPLSAALYFGRFSVSTEVGFQRRLVLAVLIIALYFGCSGILFYEIQSGVLTNICMFTGCAALSMIYPLTEFFAFMLTQSQGGFAVFIVVLLLAVFLLRRQAFSRIAVTVSLMLIIGIGVFLILDMNETVKFVKLISAKVRFEYYYGAIMMILKRPFLGFGPGCFGSAYAGYKLAHAEETQFAHNDYLQIFSESGLIAFAVYVLIFTLSVVRGLRRWREMNIISYDSMILFGSLLGVIGYLIHGLIDFDLYVPAVGLNVFLLLALVHGKCERRDHPVNIKNSWQRTGLALFAIIFLVMNCLFWGSRINAARSYKKGLDLFLGQEYSAASVYLTRAGRTDSLNSSYPFYNGISMMKTGDYQSAEYYLRKAVALNKNMPFLHYSLAQCYFSMGDNNNAGIELKKAVQCYPGNKFYSSELDKFYQKKADNTFKP